MIKVREFKQITLRLPARVYRGIQLAMAEEEFEGSLNAFLERSMTDACAEFIEGAGQSRLTAVEARLNMIETRLKDLEES